MKLMDEILGSFIDSFVVAFLDGILIFSKTWKQNMEKLKQVLETFHKNALKPNFNKKEFCKKSPVYLGFVVEGNDTKVRVILN